MISLGFLSMGLPVTHSKRSGQNESYNLVQSFLHARENVIPMLDNHNFFLWDVSAFDSLHSGRRNHHHESRLAENAAVEHNVKKIEVLVWFCINLLHPSGFFTYHQVLHSKILHGARFSLSVLYGSQNRQRFLLYTSSTDWFLLPWWKVFTAWYGLSPFKKQTRLVFKRLIYSEGQS
jgi:hypothetical protein